MVGRAGGARPQTAQIYKAFGGSSREKDDLGGQVKDYKEMGEHRWKTVSKKKRSLLMSEAAKERWSEVIAQGALAHDERTKIAWRESGDGALPLRSHEPEGRPDASGPERYRTRARAGMPSSTAPSR
jgi:hypothetical protein